MCLVCRLKLLYSICIGKTEEFMEHFDGVQCMWNLQFRHSHNNFASSVTRVCQSES